MSGQMTLGDVLLDIQAGKSFQTAEVLARPDELGVLKVSAVTWSEFRPDEAKSLSSTYTPEASHRVRKGDLLISRANTKELVGAVVLVDRDYPFRLLSDKTLRLVIDESRAEKEYLLLALRAEKARRHIEHFATGTSDSMRNIAQRIITSIPIDLPPLSDQRRIAARLNAQLAEVVVAQRSAQAQVQEAGILRSHLVRGVFRSLSNVPVKPIGEWILSYRNGFGKRPSTGEAGPIVLRIADVSSGTIDISNPRRGVVTAKEADVYRLRRNDLLFVRVNGARDIVGRCCIVTAEVPPDTIFNDHLIRVRLRPGIDPEYAQFCAGSPNMRKRIEEAASTSAGQLTINQEVVSAIEIPVLDLDDQRKIVARLKMEAAQADAIARAAAAKAGELARLSQRLLTQAFPSEAN